MGIGGHCGFIMELQRVVCGEGREQETRIIDRFTTSSFLHLGG